MEKLSLKNNLLNKEGAPNIKDSQKRSFHTFPSNRLPIDGESERIISESFKVSASSSALDFESIRTQLFFDSVPWKGIDMSDEPNVESLKQAGTQFKQFNWQRHSNGLLIAETKSTSQTQSVLLKSDSSTATHKHIHKVMSEPAAAKTATELTLERASAQKAVIEVERAKVGLKNELQAMRHANLKFNLKFATSVGGAACATVLAASALYAQSQDPTTLLGELKTWVQPHLSGNGTSK
jgi:hypothetical protein